MRTLHATACTTSPSTPRRSSISARPTFHRDRRLRAVTSEPATHAPRLAHGGTSEMPDGMEELVMKNLRYVLGAIERSARDPTSNYRRAPKRHWRPSTSSTTILILRGGPIRAVGIPTPVRSPERGARASMHEGPSRLSERYALVRRSAPPRVGADSGVVGAGSGHVFIAAGRRVVRPTFGMFLPGGPAKPRGWDAAGSRAGRACEVRCRARAPEILRCQAS